MRSRKSTGCRAVISISSTITCWATARSRASSFTGMRGMGRVFQGAATVDSILRDDTIELRRGRRIAQPVRRLRDAVDARAAGRRQAAEPWARLSRGGAAARRSRHHDQRQLRVRSRRRRSRTSSSEPSTGPSRAASPRRPSTSSPPIRAPSCIRTWRAQGRLTTKNWDLYDTRHVVYQPIGLTPQALKAGYDWSYRAFYEWGAILKGRGRAPVAEAFAQAFRVQRRLEEIRAGVGFRDPPQATGADAADARGGAVASRPVRGHRASRRRIRAPRVG